MFPKIIEMTVVVLHYVHIMYVDVQGIPCQNEKMQRLQTLTRIDFQFGLFTLHQLYDLGICNEEKKEIILLKPF